MSTVNTQTPIQQLDYFLDYLATNEYTQQPLDDRKILVNLKEKHNYEFDIGDFNRIINKLVDEKYVTKRTVDDIPYYLKESQPPSLSDLYQISFDGKLFNQSGGYKRQLKNNRIELWFKNAVTFSLIFGGVAAGIYYIVELYWKHHWFH